MMGQQVNSYRDLVVWQKSVQLVTKVYTLSRDFPRQETYGLVDQMRRAAVSIPSNIAEGQARRFTAEFRHFLHVASGSLAELDTQTVIANKLGYLSAEQLQEIESDITEIRKMLHVLIAHLPRNR